MVLHDLGELLIHEGHMDYSLGASSSNGGQLGPNLAIPIPKFDNPILVTLKNAALGSILIAPGLIMLEKMDGDNDDDASSWSSVYPHHDGDHDDMHPLGVLSKHITAQGTLI